MHTNIQYQVAVKVPGSFRPVAHSEHLYSHCNFAESLVETVLKSLHLTFQHRAGVRGYTLYSNFAPSCVFDKQSLESDHCGPFKLMKLITHFTGAFLLPKLRNYFAEFLNQSSLARLSILYLSTCVGLGYGHYIN